MLYCFNPHSRDSGCYGVANAHGLSLQPTGGLHLSTAIGYCWLRVGFTQVKAIRVVVGFKKYLSPFIASDQNVLFSFLPNADYLIQCLMIQRSRNSVKHQIKARFYSAMLVTVTIITVTWCSIHSVTLDAGFTRKEHAVRTQITLSINPPYESIYGLVGSR